MNGTCHTPKECVAICIREIDRLVLLGSCVHCAFVAVADRFGSTPGKLETLWLDAKSAEVKHANL